MRPYVRARADCVATDPNHNRVPGGTFSKTIAPSLLARHAPIVGAALLASSISALAAPVASGPAVVGNGDGLNSTWMYTGTIAAHSIADAQAVLDSAPRASTVHLVVPYVDFTDGYVDPEERFVGTTLDDPITRADVDEGDSRHSVRFSGFLNETSPGLYSFLARTADGFQLAIGGETISYFDGDRGPADTTTDLPIPLDAGLYTIEMIGWEQGGVFAFELGGIAYELIPQSALLTAQDRAATAGAAARSRRTRRSGNPTSSRATRLTYNSLLLQGPASPRFLLSFSDRQRRAQSRPHIRFALSAAASRV